MLMEDMFDDINKRRVDGTGNWIRTDALFEKWVSRTSPVLYVSGIPGSGKSFLSSNVISYLREKHPQGVQDPSHVSIGYFFFKDDKPDLRSVHQALRDLSFQIR